MAAAIFIRIQKQIGAIIRFIVKVSLKYLWYIKNEMAIVIVEKAAMYKYPLYVNPCKISLYWGCIFKSNFHPKYVSIPESNNERINGTKPIKIYFTFSLCFLTP